MSKISKSRLQAVCSFVLAAICCAAAGDASAQVNFGMQPSEPYAYYNNMGWLPQAPGGGATTPYMHYYGNGVSSYSAPYIGSDTALYTNWDNNRMGNTPYGGGGGGGYTPYNGFGGAPYWYNPYGGGYGAGYGGGYGGGGGGIGSASPCSGPYCKVSSGETDIENYLKTRYPGCVTEQQCSGMYGAGYVPYQQAGGYGYQGGYGAPQGGYGYQGGYGAPQGGYGYPQQQMGGYPQQQMGAAPGMASPGPGRSSAFGSDVYDDWVAQEGSSLRVLLQEWGDKSGWRVVWNTDREYILEAGAMFRGNYVDVSSALIRAFARATPAPIGTFYKGNRVLVIYTQESENVE